MSALARTLRQIAAELWQSGTPHNRTLATYAHAQALQLETAEFRQLSCSDPDGHVWLAEHGAVRCRHCRAPGCHESCSPAPAMQPQAARASRA